MRDYAIVGCGHCGVGVVQRLAPTCPFQGHAMCEACFAEVTRFVTEMQAQGYDPLPKPRRRRAKRQSAPTRPLL